MSKQDVESLSRLYEAFNSRDMPAMLDCLGADVEIEETSDLEYAALLLRVLGPRFVVLSGGYRGRDEVRSLFETVWAISEWFIVEPQDFIEHGDAVVVPLTLRAKSLDSGAEGEASTVHVWNMSRGKAHRLRVFADRARALDAVQA
jgi:ketosteroid isomerase-like protein